MWETYSNLFSKALKSGLKFYWKHWSVQGLHIPLKMVIINIAVDCTCLYLKKLRIISKLMRQDSIKSFLHLSQDHLAEVSWTMFPYMVSLQ